MLPITLKPSHWIYIHIYIYVYGIYIYHISVIRVYTYIYIYPIQSPSRRSCVASNAASSPEKVSQYKILTIKSPKRLKCAWHFATLMYWFLSNQPRPEASTTPVDTNLPQVLPVHLWSHLSREHLSIAASRSTGFRFQCNALIMPHGSNISEKSNDEFGEACGLLRCVLVKCHSWSKDSRLCKISAVHGYSCRCVFKSLLTIFMVKPLHCAKTETLKDFLHIKAQCLR